VLAQGTQTLTVDFPPTNTSEYAPATASVQLTVNESATAGIIHTFAGNGTAGHNGGKGQPVDHYDPSGKPITPGQAHPGNIQLPSARQIGIGIGEAAAEYLIYRAIRMMPSAVFPPLWPTIPLNAVIP
jgi:hypothetical protein